MILSQKQLFFSHTWQIDKLGRDNHKRVYNLAKKLEKCGWTIWIDEDDMNGNIDAAMADGIDNAEAIIVCLTESYCIKVNETAKDPRKRDNCLKEWTYANVRNKLMIPVIMEPCLSSITNWPPGVVSLYFGSTLYINGAKEDLNFTTISLTKMLEQYKLQPAKNISNHDKLNHDKLNHDRSTQDKLKTINRGVRLTKQDRTLYTQILFNYALFNKKPLIEQRRRRSENMELLKNNKLSFLSRKWKSTGQLLAVSI